MQPIAPVSFVQSALDAIRPSAKAGGIDLVSMLEPVEPIEGDAGRLQQVVWNLVANAIRFTPKGGKVCVELREEQDHAVITVADTGVGIKPKGLNDIFEKFRQADSSFTRKFGGLGLGRSIVQYPVELHGGQCHSPKRQGRSRRRILGSPSADGGGPGSVLEPPSRHARGIGAR